MDLRKGSTLAVAAVALGFVWWNYYLTPPAVLMRAPGHFYATTLLVVLTAGVIIGAIHLLVPAEVPVRQEVAASRAATGDGASTSDYLAGAGWFVAFNLLVTSLVSVGMALLWRGSDRWAAGIASLIGGPLFVSYFYRSWSASRRRAAYIGYGVAMLILIVVALLAQSIL